MHVNAGSGCAARRVQGDGQQGRADPPEAGLAVQVLPQASSRERMARESHAMPEMTDTAAIDAATAKENTIITSLNRHGKRRVQCFVLSRIDI